MAAVKKTYGKKQKQLERYLVDSIHSAEPSSFDKVQSWKRSNGGNPVPAHFSSGGGTALKTSNSTGAKEMAFLKIRFVNSAGDGAKATPETPWTVDSMVFKAVVASGPPPASAHSASHLARSAGSDGKLRANGLLSRGLPPRLSGLTQLQQQVNSNEAPPSEAAALLKSSPRPNSSAAPIREGPDDHTAEPSVGMGAELFCPKVTNVSFARETSYKVRRAEKSPDAANGDRAFMKHNRADASHSEETEAPPPSPLPKYRYFPHDKAGDKEVTPESADKSGKAAGGLRNPLTKGKKREGKAARSASKMAKKKDQRPSYPSLPMCSLQSIFKPPR
jgi:hypothetical protein